MSDDKPPKKKGGKGRKIIIISLLILVLGGAGAAGGFFAAGLLGGKAEAKQEDPDRPKLVLKGHGAPAGGEGKDAKPVIGTVDGNGASPRDPDKYQATYYQIDAPFTSNLKDSGAFAQISLAIGTYYDSRVLENIKQHEIAVRSAVLMRIADQDEEELSTPQGKERLQKELKDAINKVLVEKAGFGGVDNVYFTNFVIQ